MLPLLYKLILCDPEIHSEETHFTKQEMVADNKKESIQYSVAAGQDLIFCLQNQDMLLKVKIWRALEFWGFDILSPKSRFVKSRNMVKEGLRMLLKVKIWRALEFWGKVLEVTESNFSAPVNLSPQGEDLTR